MQDVSNNKDFTNSNSIKIFDFQKLLIDNFKSSCYVVDLDTYELVYANDAFFKQFGSNDKNIENRKCYEVFLNNS